MSRPGDRLRVLAARFCSADAMARLIDPLIADLQAEHAQALRHGRTWRSRQVRVAGYVAFAKVFALCDWSAVEDTRPLIRAIAISLGVIALMTAALVGIPYSGWLRSAASQSDVWRRLISLLPQALALSIPIGLMVGVAIGLAGQKVSARLATSVTTIALACSIGSVANIGWLTPKANQAFRIMVFQRTSQAPPAKGENELTFSELDRLIERQRAFPAGSYEWENVNRLRFGYHTRWAIAFANLVLAVFAMSVVVLHTKRWKTIACVVAALAGYYALLWVCRLLALNHEFAPPAAAWLPNVVFVLISAALLNIPQKVPQRT